MIIKETKYKAPKWEIVGLLVIGLILLLGLSINIKDSRGSEQSLKEQRNHIILAIYLVDTAQTYESSIELFLKRDDFENQMDFWLKQDKKGQWMGASGLESVYEFWEYHEKMMLVQINIAMEKAQIPHFKVQKRWFENDEWQNEFIFEQ